MKMLNTPLGRVPYMGEKPEEMELLLRRRFLWTQQELQRRGWPASPGELSIPQIMDIRRCPQWLNPPPLEDLLGEGEDPPEIVQEATPEEELAFYREEYARIKALLKPENPNLSPYQMVEAAVRGFLQTIDDSQRAMSAAGLDVDPPSPRKEI